MDVFMGIEEECLIHIGLQFGVKYLFETKIKICRAFYSKKRHVNL